MTSSKSVSASGRESLNKIWPAALQEMKQLGFLDVVSYNTLLKASQTFFKSWKVRRVPLDFSSKRPVPIISRKQHHKSKRKQ